ncbi:MAG: DUF4468 domain-containing protein [Cyclobacteriaceae bacterium]|nr:DUF4468 domain-containing protein [Cyclobacteriaceae bacterium]
MVKITVFLIISTFYYSLTQDTQFPIDDLGKYTITEVVELHGIDKDKLFLNGEKFMKKVKVLNSKKKYYKIEKDNYTITNKGSFYVYRIGSVKKGIGGAVEYDIDLEIKDGKYRYTITNFIFNEYQRNRYGKYEPVKGKFIPLEMEVSSINKKEWEKHKQVVFEKSLELIQNLYSEMIYAEEKKNKKVKKDDNW